jgi:hypothetical protein
MSSLNYISMSLQPQIAALQSTHFQPTDSFEDGNYNYCQSSTAQQSNVRHSIISFLLETLPKTKDMTQPDTFRFTDEWGYG